MALYLIKRNVPGASSAEIDAAAFRAMACAYSFPGLRWIHSYWDPKGGATYCIYEAESREQIEDHARRARIPCDEVMPVNYMTPSEYAGGQEEPQRLEPTAP
jgi:hypothetical protein